jgi:hypothetical protein
VFPGLLPLCSTSNTACARARVATGCAVSRSSLSSAWTSDGRCEYARSVSRGVSAGVPPGCSGSPRTESDGAPPARDHVPPSGRRIVGPPRPRRCRTAYVTHRCGFHVERTPHTDPALVLPRFPMRASDRPDDQVPLRSLRGRADARHVSRGTQQCADGWCPCGTCEERRSSRSRTMIDENWASRTVRAPPSPRGGERGPLSWARMASRDRCVRPSVTLSAEQRVVGLASADGQRRRRRLARPSGPSERRSGLSPRVPRSGRGARSSSAGDRAGASSGR